MDEKEEDVGEHVQREQRAAFIPALCSSSAVCGL